MKRNQSGFTLIEIAIVLVIIGLLLGGVLKGQELINSAKVKNLATDFKNIPVYIYGYQDKFRALPGDDGSAASHVEGATVASTNGTINNGVIEGAWDTLTFTDETQKFWQDVRLAGLATGPTADGADLLPTNSVNGIIGITNSGTNNPTLAGNLLRGSYIICSAAILGKYAKQLDIQMDDGAPTTGSMRAYNTNNARPSTLAAPTLNAGGALEDANSYTVCMGV
ncbi:MAG: prepilin-type N-terminal cleavage/methylation domain-containing protein [Gammaproteobacteria bacterium]|nr:prepilin-type N-terminal cleavage/methylation domain-containing protein [Gammaproteobacteria bacterium]MBU1481407.1 prepilin-type N-terminal cleavage/methylation domain-containing protein [Gammaproteobacteria bacterium]